MSSVHGPRRGWLIASLVIAILASACGRGGNDSKTPTATRGAVAQSTPTPGASQQPGSSPTAAAPTVSAVALSPSIADALSCRVPPVRKDTGSANGQLQRYDLTAFPAASCNDGSAAVLYFRPYEGQANKDKWIIVLNGGGACGNGQDCADRWCGVNTNFDADNMSTANAGGSLNGDGLLERAADNPFGNYNQVQVRYCSSDVWTGQGLGVKVSAKDPKTGKDVSFEMNFAGGYVYQAMLAVLRGEGPDKLVYTKTKTTMPDLDQATEVVFAGGSAGGDGVIFNLDRLADALRSGANKPAVYGFIEAIVGPDKANLGYASTSACTDHGVCSYEAYYKALYAKQQDPAGPREWTDESCLEWQKKNDPGSEWKCYNQNYLLANHITTPYFIRTSLTDALRSRETIDQGFSTPDGKPLTVLTYGEATADFLNGLHAAMAAGAEHGAVTKLPGIFGTACHTHYTLLQTNLVQGVKVTANGKAYGLLDVWNNWISGKQPDVVVTTAPRTDVCPGE